MYINVYKLFFDWYNYFSYISKTYVHKKTQCLFWATIKMKIF